MINIKELKGNTFKKELGLNRCRFGYHNKNNNGGNFGLDFYLNEEFNENTDFSLNGHYNINGDIGDLKIMSIRVGCFIISIPKEKKENINDLISFLKEVYINLNKNAIVDNL